MPTPLLSGWWNFGSLLGICLGVQIVTGVFLALQYTADVGLSFFRVGHIIQDIRNGWALRIFHANGASFFFFCLYLHIGRGIYYGSYRFVGVWVVGVAILLAVIATAFLGYVLPWGQISFWGATVITDLLSVIPFQGKNIVKWLWGGFAVRNATLTRFFTFHFLLPFVIAFIVVIHLLFLHERGSSNPLGLAEANRLAFSPYYVTKDILGATIIILLLLNLAALAPWILGDPENFIAANPLVTPVHIQPEWYFLFAYAILRSIPNKLGGVVALVLSVLILASLSASKPRTIKPGRLYPIRINYFWSLVVVVGLLTWVGARPAEEPFVFLAQVLSVIYFLYFFLAPQIRSSWDSLIL